MASIKLSREELYELVWSKPITHIAPDLGISGRGLGKICVRLDIPVPGRGYWQKLEQGHKVEKDPLPSLSNGIQSYAWFRGPQKKFEPIILPEADIVEKTEAFESHPSNRIVVPKKVNRYDPLVKRTLELLLESRCEKQGLYRPTGKKALYLNCSKELAPRAARIYNTLIQSCDKRGFSLYAEQEYPHNTYITCFEEKLKISLRERLKKIPFILPKGQKPSTFGDPQFRFVPSGNLALRIDEYSDYREDCVDNDERPLEEQLNDFMVKLSKAALCMKHKRAERERFERQLKEECLAAENVKRQTAIEKARREDLEKLVSNWMKSRRIREFIEAVRTLPPFMPYEDMDKEQWLTWASSYADELDPFFS